MDMLKSMFGYSSQILGGVAVANWLGIFATYYTWQWLGWSFLVSLNGLFLTTFPIIMWAAAGALAVNLILKLGTWVRGLFGAKD
jgi:hypothetical protein